MCLQYLQICDVNKSLIEAVTFEKLCKFRINESRLDFGSSKSKPRRDCITFKCERLQGQNLTKIAPTKEFGRWAYFGYVYLAIYDKILSFGGSIEKWCRGFYYEYIWVYDIAKDEWDILDIDLPTELNSCKVLYNSYDDMIHVKDLLGNKYNAKKIHIVCEYFLRDFKWKIRKGWFMGLSKIVFRYCGQIN